MERRVKIVTDSAADMPAAQIEQHQINVIPLSIRFDEEEFVDGVTLSAADFYTKLASSSDLPSTAAPSPGAFEAAFRAAQDEGFEGVLCINLASGLSGTYQSARSAAALVGDDFPVRIVDSKSATCAEASLVLEAARLAEAGQSLDEITAAVEAMANKVKMFGFLDTLEYLRKGGRIGAAGAFFGSLLSVKPIITIEDGAVKPQSRARTRSKAMAELAKIVVDHAPISHVGVTHSGAPDVNEFLELIRSAVDPADVLVSEIGPTIATHGGPRLIAVSFVSEK